MDEIHILPPLEADLVNATVVFPEGSPISQSQEAVNLLHKSAENYAQSSQ